MKFPRRARDPVEIGLAPLLDVIFILLLFFVVSTSFSREAPLQLELPESASTAPASPPQGLELRIDAAGRYQLNQQPLADAAALAQALAARQAEREQGLLISADARTAHQAVVTALDIAAQQGFTRLRINTLPRGEAP
ncbi:biopolymer transporter ExbD [Pseudomonas sp. NW5]|uniref:ExbD/TolR family protein n=1 Tax=Pseudomonas sp. NW5 TaxID=2934934 RepID=UPI00201FFB19|nr:biopolymer transporter ExbD [Pseudomonas sp. NW5]